MPEPGIALVTGAGSGLGAVIAERLGRSGLTIAVNTRSRAGDAEAVVAAIESAGGHAFSAPADVADAASVRGMFDGIAHHGRVRVVVNNASYRPRSPFADITEEDWHAVHSVTLDGAFLCIRNALPTLVPGGRVVNILGRNALDGDPKRVHVSSAKYGLLGLTRALSASLRADGVAVNAISPGIECAGIDLDRCRDEIAEQVARLTVEPTEVTGTVVRVDCDGSEVVSAVSRAY
ncbi:MAG: 3-oxoacyl-[acyl-carrier protein] reductase [Mycobacterium sp.]|jgi:3-oxoacyl-[acyl-carrier protein] reductase|nr:3-oxoacyl-[acyl-carrier protein] reductase [Mycobacterium sp.]